MRPHPLIGLGDVMSMPIRWYGDDPEWPAIRRGQCWCGAPIMLEQLDIRLQRHLLSHGEVPLLCYSEPMLIQNDLCRDNHFEVGVCLLREAFTWHHLWLDEAVGKYVVGHYGVVADGKDSAPSLQWLIDHITPPPGAS